MLTLHHDACFTCAARAAFVLRAYQLDLVRKPVCLVCCRVELQGGVWHGLLQQIQLPQLYLYPDTQLEAQYSVMTSYSQYSP